MARVVVVQQYVPAYRVEFFRQLVASARDSGIDVVVAAGGASRLHQARGDAADPEFLIRIRQHELRMGRRRVVFRSLRRALANADIVVVEQARRNLDLYPRLLWRGKRQPRVVLWGHGRDFSQASSPLSARLLRWLTVRSHWFLAYTSAGASDLIAHGYPKERVTVLNNSIDTKGLACQLAAISESLRSAYARRLDLRGSTALYIGALDTYKRIPFLLESAEVAHGLNPDFRLLIAGNGSDRKIVERFAARHEWVHFLGSLVGEEKALALASSQVVTVPGAIGLVALDAMVAGAPVVTTEETPHGPEFEYLVKEQAVVATRNDSQSYGAGIIGLLEDDGRLELVRESTAHTADSYNLTNMVDSYCAGLASALDHSSERRLRSDESSVRATRRGRHASD